MGTTPVAPRRERSRIVCSWSVGGALRLIVTRETTMFSRLPCASTRIRTAASWWHCPQGAGRPRRPGRGQGCQVPAAAAEPDDLPRPTPQAASAAPTWTCPVRGLPRMNAEKLKNQSGPLEPADRVAAHHGLASSCQPNGTPITARTCRNFPATTPFRSNVESHTSPVRTMRRRAGRIEEKSSPRRMVGLNGGDARAVQYGNAQLADQYVVWP